MSAVERVRALGFETFLWLSVIVYGSVILLLYRFISRRRLHAIAHHWERSVLWSLRWMCGLSYRVTGLEHLRQGTGQVILSNHQSSWETIALGTFLPQPQTWVMKRELLRVPFFGWALAVFDPIAIERSAGRKAMKQLLTVGSERLALGHTIVIFPEGTRVAPGQVKRFGIGGAMLAAGTGMQVIPIAHNAGCFWGRHQLRKRPGVIDVVIGAPIETKGLSAGAINALAEDWIQSTARSLVKDAEGGALEGSADTARG